MDDIRHGPRLRKDVHDDEGRYSVNELIYHGIAQPTLCLADPSDIIGPGKIQVNTGVSADRMVESGDPVTLSLQKGGTFPGQAFR